MYLRTIQDWIIRPQLKTVPGVAEIDAIGGYAQQYHVQPDPQKLASLGLTFTDVIEALERNNTSTGAGFLEQNGEAYVVRADGRINAMEDIANVVVASRNSTPIHIDDVAIVEYGKELRTGSASENGMEVGVNGERRLSCNFRSVQGHRRPCVGRPGACRKASVPARICG